MTETSDWKRLDIFTNCDAGLACNPVSFITLISTAFITNPPILLILFFTTHLNGISKATYMFQ
jgi:hypothetical protein